jgi:hypothetical protein
MAILLILIRRYAVLAFVALAGLTPAQSHAQTTDVPQVFLIQNSGWMLGYYRDHNAGFREFLRDLIMAAGTGSSRVVIADFNQDGQVAGRSSPREIYNGPPVADKIYAKIKADFADAPPRRKDQAQAWADTDFAGALKKAFTDYVSGQPAVIWIITNNKFAPSGKASL